MEEHPDAKWKLPGWRIEQRYATDVLIGNWNEERRVFERWSWPFFDSTQRIDFKNYGKYLPDVTTRRKALEKHDGLGKEHLFAHHQKAYEGNRISWYDQQFNRREMTESKLPPLRSWDRQKLAWAPEKSDFPVQGHPTNYGLLRKLQEKWKKEAAMENFGTHTSTYKLSYSHQPKEAFVLKHHAPPKSMSCHFHPHQVNKNLRLRGKQLIAAPESPMTLAVPHNVPPDFPQSTVLAV